MESILPNVWQNMAIITGWFWIFSWNQFIKNSSMVYTTSPIFCKWLEYWCKLRFLIAGDISNFVESVSFKSSEIVGELHKLADICESAGHNGNWVSKGKFWFSIVDDLPGCVELRSSRRYLCWNICQPVLLANCKNMLQVVSAWSFLYSPHV